MIFHSGKQANIYFMSLLYTAWWTLHKILKSCLSFSVCLPLIIAFSIECSGLSKNIKTLVSFYSADFLLYILLSWYLCKRHSIFLINFRLLIKNTLNFLLIFLQTFGGTKKTIIWHIIQKNYEEYSIDKMLLIFISDFHNYTYFLKEL